MAFLQVLTALKCHMLIQGREISSFGWRFNYAAIFQGTVRLMWPKEALLSPLPSPVAAALMCFDRRA